MTKTITRISFCTRCRERGIPAEKQFLSGEICLSCGSRISAPESHEVPGAVARLTRSLAESFMFQLESFELLPGDEETQRLHLSSRALPNFTCTIHFHESFGALGDQMQNEASWDDHLSSHKLNPHEFVRNVGRHLNNTMKVECTSMFVGVENKPVSRATALFQTIDERSRPQKRSWGVGAFRFHLTRSVPSTLWINIELSWEEIAA